MDTMYTIHIPPKTKNLANEAPSWSGLLARFPASKAVFSYKLVA